jgi:hypothetical protein
MYLLSQVLFYPLKNFKLFRTKPKEKNHQLNKF